MSGVASAAGGFKAPPGVGGRQDGGGPGSGNWYGQFGDGYEEEMTEENNPMRPLIGNPFQQLVFTSPVIKLKSALMKSFSTTLAVAHYQKAAQHPVPVASYSEY